ncbi:alpha-ketoacid dehydrogenase subunit alpha/beta [Rhabdobacter roseus]|uniref:Pyruvate/2-oxoglutarate/acetoin dehydrogenase E1 component/TPP-dependent pyruvate/acetoin dehydrogenase alpha subunit n=1 Tax=Rhabdobacter roseus TaxID=1655419 RepID=A0A840TT76_9BACT|nr:alpha-ketoacid dehydrogenase subunit alpha/beta [Rhabdobacter roseus]MBB5284867.1 pyruvate/2-oxoglutarate/acetoin dehydrogenase E1 component/TPP-dependent pyruvate/acetoin dehydrogenase alpha subunit [Rhabdobacter roseus]
MLLNEILPENSVLTQENILDDYRLSYESRQVSLLGRKDVMGGRAKFGIFGDGKEVAQVAMARAFRRGDFRSGYYRDQTIEAALGNLTWQQFFAQIYAHADVDHEPHTGGRSMNGHYATRWLDEQGHWRDQTQLYNSVCDISPTAGQIPRALGLAYASKLYRLNQEIQHLTSFSRQGNEIVFATIGDASTSQGMFWETMNAAGVLQVPLLMSVWDDGYGISVPIEYQTTKGSISKALAGLQRNEDEPGIEIFAVKGWDYPALIETYQKAAALCRSEHVPVLVHVQELTQPQGHSSSGSHERYKSKNRLMWEAEHDCNLLFRDWILDNGYASEENLESIEAEAKEKAREARNLAWKAYRSDIEHDQQQAVALLEQAARESTPAREDVKNLLAELQKTYLPLRRDLVGAVRKALRYLRSEPVPAQGALQEWLRQEVALNEKRYSTHLYSQSDESPLNVEAISAVYEPDSPLVDGREIVRSYFDALFARDPRLVALGEDVGQIGDVNQGFAGLQEKYGEIRITDTGIRETTIIGQGIGLAMRGLRPVVEIQYFDYVYYALATLTDDLATLRYRTAGGQKAPLIIRTRGHRLEGIWHSGSPLGTMINSLRGLHIVVPRNFTQAAGFYNTLMQGDDPALVIEPLNSYRLKERLPANLDTLCLPLGQPEILREGTHLTLVTYGSMCRLALEAATQLAQVGIEIEVIDVQTLLPFDREHRIVESVKKTNRVLFADEDMPGGASAYMLQQVLEEQNAYRWLDSPPRTLAAREHRPPYGSDGDYFSKPNVEDIFNLVYEIMQEAEPQNFPGLY